MSSAEVVHQLRLNAQPGHNQMLGKSISSSFELERMHNLHRIKSLYRVASHHCGKIHKCNYWGHYYVQVAN